MLHAPTTLAQIAVVVIGAYLSQRNSKFSEMLTWIAATPNPSRDPLFSPRCGAGSCTACAGSPVIPNRPASSSLSNTKVSSNATD
jgi:hypothetical protein